jgi:hypothetical protein
VDENKSSSFDYEIYFGIHLFEKKIQLDTTMRPHRAAADKPFEFWLNDGALHALDDFGSLEAQIQALEMLRSVPNQPTKPKRPRPNPNDPVSLDDTARLEWGFLVQLLIDTLGSMLPAGRTSGGVAIHTQTYVFPLHALVELFTRFEGHGCTITETDMGLKITITCPIVIVRALGVSHSAFVRGGYISHNTHTDTHTPMHTHTPHAHALQTHAHTHTYTNTHTHTHCRRVALEEAIPQAHLKVRIDSEHELTFEIKKTSTSGFLKRSAEHPLISKRPFFTCACGHHADDSAAPAHELVTTFYWFNPALSD